MIVCTINVLCDKMYPVLIFIRNNIVENGRTAYAVYCIDFKCIHLLAIRIEQCCKNVQKLWCCGRCYRASDAWVWLTLFPFFSGSLNFQLKSDYKYGMQRSIQYYLCEVFQTSQATSWSVLKIFTWSEQNERQIFQKHNADNSSSHFTVMSSGRTFLHAKRRLPLWYSSWAFGNFREKNRITTSN